MDSKQFSIQVLSFYFFFTFFTYNFLKFLLFNFKPGNLFKNCHFEAPKLIYTNYIWYIFTSVQIKKKFCTTISKRLKEKNIFVSNFSFRMQKTETQDCKPKYYCTLKSVRITYLLSETERLSTGERENWEIFMLDK